MAKLRLKKYTDFIVAEAEKLLAIDSPSGYTEAAAQWVMAEFAKLRFEPKQTIKGGVLVKLSNVSKDAEKAAREALRASQRDSDCNAEECARPGIAQMPGGLLLEAHCDTLGAMVSEVRDGGRLSITPLGGMNANNAEAENVRVVTKFGGVLDGTCQLKNASTHVNGKYNEIVRKWDEMEIVLDEDIKKKEDAEKLGLGVGDIICFDPRTRVTKSGYIKSRFLDDKLSVAILLGYAKYLKESGAKTSRDVWAHITVYEEVGHGGSASVPEGVTEALSVDMGCVGQGLACTERPLQLRDRKGAYRGSQKDRRGLRGGHLPVLRI